MRNTPSTFRNGTRSLDRRLDRHATTLLAGARRPRRPNDLAVACRWLNQHLRLARRLAREDPQLFGPHARRYFLETLQLETHEMQIDAGVRKVYGPPAPGEPARVSTLWTDRYCPRPEQRKAFRKWFNAQYPARHP